ncbi:HNH endonuclease [Propioniciclava sp. MC1683]|uniref:NACHT domain-containing protein n=1 Tax=Propioniciclava sp. MC1683 TaxID=2760309 RepID=UPI001600B437|nr:HNH endonuclease [Propioniciclava sp. MC1683]MBB1502502.1 HNH endonuclease [Propioniciclava sp. MC1683]
MEDVVGGNSGLESSVVVGEEAHIYGFAVGGPRYDPTFPEERLETYENRILLCQKHHTIIDSQGGVEFNAKTLIRMKSDHEQGLRRDQRLMSAAKAYLGGQMEADDRVQFRQARLDGPTVESMFVDVPFGCRKESPPADFLERLAKAHPGDLRPEPGFVATGAAQALLHPGWTGNALIIGGPGQGKSTLLQYICQFHRARYLGRDEYSGDVQGLKPVTTTARIPVKIELRRYAEWSLNHDPRAPLGSQRWLPIEVFLMEELNRGSGVHEINAEDFTHLVANYPMLIALDGLDEVANLEHRERTADEIAAMAGRLSPDAHDLTIIVATRPGHMQSRLLNSPLFPRFNLLTMSAGLRLQYLNRWIQVSELTDVQAQALRQTYLSHEELPHIRDLASYPMQFAILLHLLRDRGLFPKQRTELYAEYLKAFLDREETENKDPLVSSQRTVLMQVHAYLGWHLQAAAESSGDSGQLPRSALRGLLRSYFADQSSGLEFAEELFKSMESRVLCLVEREEGFQFEVQSLREYFAALYAHENADPRGKRNSRVACFEAMVKRPYWLNVCRFFVGMFTTIEIRGIHSTLQDLMDKADPGLATHLRIVAARLLDDRSYQGQSDREVGRVVEFILKGPGVVFSEDGFLDDAGSPHVFAGDAGRASAVDWLRNEVVATSGEPARRELVSASLGRNSTEDEDVRAWWRDGFQPNTDWLAVASQFGIVAPTRRDRSRLAKCLEASKDSETRWGTELLLRGGYAGIMDELTGPVLHDLNDGLITELAGIGTQLEAVCAAAKIAAGSVDLALWSDLSAFAARSQGGPNEVVARSVQLGRAANVAGGTQWRKRLEEIGRIWGQGWVLAQAVAMTPLTIDLENEGWLISDDTAASAAVRWEVQVRAHRDDPAWWTDVYPGDPLPQRIWLLDLLAHAKSRVVADLMPQVDLLVCSLAPRHFRSLQMSLKRTAPTLIDLQERLRLNLLSADGRTLWLLRGICTDGTQAQIDKRLRSALAEILAAGAGDSTELLKAIGAAKTTAVSVFKNCRDSVSAGGMEYLKLTAMPMKLAHEVLSAPEEWPTAVVGQALGRVSGALAKLEPVGEIAIKDQWFPRDD